MPRMKTADLAIFPHHLHCQDSSRPPEPPCTFSAAFYTDQLALQVGNSNEDAASLLVEDEVEFVVEDHFRTDKRHATNLKLLARAAEKRELGTVSDWLQLSWFNLWPIKGICIML